MNNSKLLIGTFGAFVAICLGLYFFSYYVFLSESERKGWFVFDEVTSHDAEHPDHLHWSFDGPFGTVDKQSAQRGYQVYKEVCASCHGMRLFSFRNLAGLGFSEDEIKVLAAEYDYDYIDDDGEVSSRAGVPNDRFPEPYPNKKAAAAVNNGKAPPDLTLMVKARHDGPNYIYSLMTGYYEPPADMDLGVGSYYNPYYPGKQIAMAPPLADGQVEYADGTEATVKRMSKDLVNFLQYAAEPEMEERKRMGVKAIAFLVIMTIFFYIAKIKIWARVK